MSPLLPILKDQVAESADEYKPSLYNFFVERGDTVWGINFRSMALVRLDQDRYRQAQSLLDDPLLDTASESLQALREDLIKGRFLIPRSLDEIELLKTKH
jgi:hypothetical protein